MMGFRIQDLGFVRLVSVLLLSLVLFSQAYAEEKDEQKSTSEQTATTDDVKKDEKPSENANEEYSGKVILNVNLEMNTPETYASIFVNDATVSYYERAKKTGKETNADIETDKTKFTDLWWLVDNEEFWPLKKSYNTPAPEKGAVYTVTVMYLNSGFNQRLQNAIEKKVICQGSCPNAFVEITKKMKEMWGKDITGVTAEDIITDAPELDEDGNPIVVEKPKDEESSDENKNEEKSDDEKENEDEGDKSEDEKDETKNDDVPVSVSPEGGE